QQGSAGQNIGFHAGFRSNNLFTCAFYVDDLDTVASYTDSDWHKWTCTYDASTKTRTIYRDGVNVASDTATDHFTGSGTFYLGWDGMVNEGFNGQLDESRLLNVALSSQWLQTEFNNQNDSDSFYSISSHYQFTGKDWSYFKEIAIDNTKVASDLTNFPVLISIYDEDLKTSAQSDGDDIAFFGIGENQLAHEVEVYDPSFNSTHAKLTAWVKTDLSGSSDTTIIMKYGNPDLTSQENPSLVWSSDYNAVWHLSEDPSGSEPQMLDSTIYANEGTTAASPSQISGKIENGLSFDDSNERSVDVSDSSSLQLSSTIVVSAWIKTVDIDSDVGLIINKWGSTTADRNYWLGKLDGSNFAFYVDDTQSVQIALSNLNDGQWHFVVGVADSSTIKLYVDGSEINSAPYSGSSRTGTSLLAIGRASGEIQQEWNGDIDEIKISSSLRSGNWILTEFNNQNDPDSFYSISPQYQSTGEDWSYFKEIVIDNTKVASDLTNFPILISIYDEDLKTSAQTGGDDIAFFDIGGNQLAHEIETYDSSFNSTHAKLAAWVKTDLSGSSDTTIIMKYGAMDLMSQENPSLVWSSNYSGVWHLNEDPSVTAPQMLDSTTNNYDGTTQGSMTVGDQIEGQIGGSLDFDGIDDYIDTNYIGITGSNARTISFWMNTSTLEDRDIFNYGDNSQNRFNIRIDESNTAGNWVIRLEMKDATNLVEQRWSTHVADGNWNYITVVIPESVDITQTLSYIDGQPDTIDSTIGTGTADSGSGGSQNVRIGNFLVKPVFSGLLDEVRISNTIRSSDWILTEYNNQNAPSSFYSVGSQQDETSVTIEEYVSVGATSGDTLISPSITGVDNDLYLAVISTKIYRDTTSVTGLGLTWTEIADQPAGRSQTAISTWWAQGNASTGAVTATVSSAVTDSMTMQIHRLSGVDTSNPIGNYSSSNTNGVGGGGTGGTDNTLPTLDITTTTSRSMVFGAVALRSRTFTVGNGYNLVATSYAGSGGGGSGIAVEQRGKTVAETVTINGTLDTISDWAVIGIEIKPEVIDYTINYQLEWEHQAQSVDTAKEVYELAIYGFSSDAEESFEIQMWDTSSSSWTNPLSTKIGSTKQWYNNTISGSGIIGSTITWRYRGDNEVHDLVQSTLNIDYAAIVSYHENPIFVTSANDLQYNEGSTANILTWNSTDLNPDSYTIYQNGSQVDTGTWSNAADIQINVDSLSKGVYNYTIVVADSYSNQITDTSWVTVVDVTDPVYVTTPIDMQYSEGSTSNTLTWNSTDLHADSYTIYQNGSQVDTGTWTNASEITINVDGLSEGVYNYTIVATDTTDNQAVDTVIVTVLDGTDPVFVTTPNDMQYNEGSTSNTLTWNSTDLHADSYTVYQNGSQVDTGTWTNATEITINVDGLSKGAYNFTIVITDTSGNQI
ncbi:MAG: LamG-like jellyroll fold domain-containing protein, partial [Candidatus Kariarchaeaceae archaeon]